MLAVVIVLIVAAGLWRHRQRIDAIMNWVFFGGPVLLFVGFFMFGALVILGAIFDPDGLGRLFDGLCDLYQALLWPFV